MKAYRFLLLLMVTFLTGTSYVFSANYTVSMLTDAQHTGNNIYPKISGDYVVWSETTYSPDGEGWFSSESTIKYHNLQDITTIDIPSVGEYPYLSNYVQDNGKVAMQGYHESFSHNQIFYFDGTTTTQITNPSNDISQEKQMIRISGDKFVYRSHPDAGPFHVRLWDGAQIVELSTDSLGTHTHDISGNNVLLRIDVDPTNGQQYEHFYYNIQTQETTRLTYTSTNDDYLAVEGDKAVWQTPTTLYNEYENWEIFYYDLSNIQDLVPGEHPNPVQISPANDVYANIRPVIGKDIIVWARYDTTQYGFYTSAYYNLYVYDLNTGEGSVIASNLSMEDTFYYTVDQNQVVWQQSDGTYSQIYTYNYETGTLTQLTNDSYNHLYPTISNGKIVWGREIYIDTWQPDPEEYGGQTYYPLEYFEIWMASESSDTIPEPLTMLLLFTSIMGLVSRKFLKN